MNDVEYARLKGLRQLQSEVLQDGLDREQYLTEQVGLRRLTVS